MTSDLHEGPLEAAPAIAPARTSWREERRNRRRRRIWFEEILGWILVPIIVVGCYWLLVMSLEAVGTSPSAIIDGLHNIIANF